MNTSKKIVSENRDKKEEPSNCNELNRDRYDGHYDDDYDYNSRYNNDYDDKDFDSELDDNQNPQESRKDTEKEKAYSYPNKNRK